MPFIGTKRLRQIEKRELMPEQVGDLCALAYKPMVEKWLANPSWTTAHRIRKDIFYGQWFDVYFKSRLETISPWLLDEVPTAIKLAWEVFFQIYVMPYEYDKLFLNGGVIDECN